MKLDAKTHDYFGIIHKNCNSIEFTFDKKNSLYIPLFTTSIDHGLSIHLLEKQNLVVSCLALTRACSGPFRSPISVQSDH